MADQTTLMGLLKTPSQIRKEQQDRLMEESLARSQMMLRGSTGGSTALPGIISSYGAQAAQRGAQAGAGLLRGVAGGIGQAVGGDMGQRISALGVPVEERQARMQQEAVRTTGGTSTIEGLTATIEKLRKAGAPAEVILRLSEKLAELKTEKQSTSTYQGVEITADNYMEVANKMIQEGDLDEGLRLMDLFTQDPGALERDLNYIAQQYFPNQDLSDPVVRTKAMEMLIDYKRQDPTVAPAFTAAQEQLDASLESATNARRTAQTADRALDILASGDVNVGSFANTRQGAEKFYEQVLTGLGFDVSGEEAVQRTETLLATSRQLSAELLGSGIFGSGTGISERDLLEAQRISGAAADLTPAGMRRILQLNAKMARAKIKAHNDRVGRYDNRFWESSPFRGKEAFIVEMPSQSVTAQATRIIENDAGVVLYEIEGEWVTADGTPWKGE